MPVELEHKLMREAKEKGYRKGSKHYDAYVYGTMNKLGMLSHNHAGNLGPDKLLKGKMTLHADYKSAIEGVHGIHIGVIVVIGLIIWWMYFRGIGPKYVGSSVNGDGASSYLNTQEYSGWISYQYNSLGAKAGALTGESN